MQEINLKAGNYLVVYNPLKKRCMLVDYELDILLVYWRRAYVLNGDLIIEDTKCKLYTNLVDWTTQVKYEFRKRNLGHIICQTNDEALAIKICKNSRKKGE